MRKSLEIVLATSLLVAGPWTSWAQSHGTTIEDVKQADRQAVTTTGHYTEQQLKELKGAAERQVRRLKKKIDDMKTEARNKTGQTRADLDRKIAEAEKKMNALKPTLKRLKTATRNNWVKVKSAFDKGVQDLEQIINEASNHHSTAKG